MTAQRSRSGGAARHRQRLGWRGEQLAADWYAAHGYEIVARNWRCRDGELDLVARRDGEVVFCEVKARSSDRFGLPAEAVTVRKQRRLRTLAARFLADARATGARDVGGRIRFDVAAVIDGHVEIIEAAF